jgi:hypothetical protein
MDHRLMAALLVAGASDSASYLKTAQAFTAAAFLAARHEAGRIASSFGPSG